MLSLLYESALVSVPANHNSFFIMTSLYLFILLIQKISWLQNKNITKYFLLKKSSLASLQEN